MHFIINPLQICCKTKYIYIYKEKSKVKHVARKKKNYVANNRKGDRKQERNKKNSQVMFAPAGR
jgi:hypothetical protein